jgi:hypothetical protein
MSSPEAEPIEKLMLKLTTKVHFYSSARAKADSEQKAGSLYSSPPHIANPLAAAGFFIVKLVL